MADRKCPKKEGTSPSFHPSIEDVAEPVRGMTIPSALREVVKGLNLGLVLVGLLLGYQHLRDGIETQYGAVLLGVVVVLTGIVNRSYIRKGLVLVVLLVGYQYLRDGLETPGLEAPVLNQQYWWVVGLLFSAVVVLAGIVNRSYIGKGETVPHFVTAIVLDAVLMIFGVLIACSLRDIGNPFSWEPLFFSALFIIAAVLNLVAVRARMRLVSGTEPKPNREDKGWVPSDTGNRQQSDGESPTRKMDRVDEYVRSRQSTAEPEEGTDVSQIDALADTIVETSAQCTAGVKDSMHFDSEERRQYQAVWVWLEFICFFTHMTMRIAFKDLGPRRRDMLQQKLRPLVIEALHVRCVEGEQEYNEHMRSLFHKYVDNSEKEYSACREFISDPATTDNTTAPSVLSSLARNVMELCGRGVPQTKGHPTDWTYTDYDVADAIACRYSTDPAVLNPIAFEMVIYSAGIAFKRMDLPKWIASLDGDF